MRTSLRGTLQLCRSSTLTPGCDLGRAPQEDKDGFCNAVRSEVKASGLLDTADACWDYFIAKTRRLLHVVLCFSPVGDKFRIRARQVPALVNCTQARRGPVLAGRLA